jgi:hypothetical protein
MNKLLLNLEKQIDQTEELVRRMRDDLSDTVKELSPDVNFRRAIKLSEEQVLVMDLDAPAEVKGDIVIKRKVSAISGINFVEYARIEK